MEEKIFSLKMKSLKQLLGGHHCWSVEQTADKNYFLAPGLSRWQTMFHFQSNCLLFPFPASQKLKHLFWRKRNVENESAIGDHNRGWINNCKRGGLMTKLMLMFRFRSKLWKSGNQGKCAGFDVHMLCALLHKLHIIECQQISSALQFHKIFRNYFSCQFYVVWYLISCMFQLTIWLLTSYNVSYIFQCKSHLPM